MSKSPGRRGDPTDTSDAESDSSNGGLTRRDFLTGTVATAAGAVYLLEGSGEESVNTTDDGLPLANESIDGRIPILDDARPEFVADLRSQTGNRVQTVGVADHAVESDALRGHLDRFTKGLTHDTAFQVSPETYQSLLDALAAGNSEALEDIDRGGDRRLVDPLGSYTVPLVGMDSHEIAIAEPPALDSQQMAAEMAELYWQSLLRDVPFRDYPQNELAQRAAEDLSQFDALEAPRDENGTITPDLLFRGNLPGSTVGPYQSQFLLKPAPWGAHEMDQRIEISEPGIDYLTDRDQLLAVYNGAETQEKAIADQRRLMMTGRDISSCVHRDVVPAQFQIAVNILIGRPVDGVPADQPEIFDARNPYNDHPAAVSFVNHARTQFFQFMQQAARCALMTAWFNKWQVHRRQRPEKVGALLDIHMAGDADYEDVLPTGIFDSSVLTEVFQRQQNFLLSQAFPEGCPAHPSYPGGHATVAAAVATTLKGLLNEDHVIEDPVVPSENGQALVPYEGGEQLTVGGELNKLVDNVNLGGRHFAGVHYRSDTEASYVLGERVGMRVLQDFKLQSVESPDVQLTTFDGETITI